MHPKKKITPQKPQRSVFEKRANNLPSDSGGERLESLEGLRSAQEAPFEFLSRLAFLRSLSREKNISYIFQDPPPLRNDSTTEIRNRRGKIYKNK